MLNWMWFLLWASVHALFVHSRAHNCSGFALISKNAKVFPWLIIMNIRLLFPFPCSIFILLQHKAVCAFFSCSSCCSCCVPLLQLFSTFCIIMFLKPFLLWLCRRSEPLLMPPHREILDAGVLQGLVGESAPQRVQGWRVERKIKCPAGLLKQIVCDDGQNHVSLRRRDIGDCEWQ